MHRHRRQLRVRLLLVPLPRRHDRVRGQALRRDLHRRVAEPARSAGTAPSSPRASTARTTSTSSTSGWTWRSTATRNRVYEVDADRRARRARTTRTATPGGTQEDADARTRRWRRRDWPTRWSGRYWKIVNAERQERARPARRLQAAAGDHVLGRSRSRAPQSPTTRAVHAQAPVGDRRTTRTSCSPRATTRTRRPAAAGPARVRRQATARWTTPTWCSGTPSAPTTSSARRTGRSCRSTRSASSSPVRLLRRQPGARQPPAGRRPMSPSLNKKPKQAFAKSIN